MNKQKKTTTYNTAATRSNPQRKKNKKQKTKDAPKTTYLHYSSATNQWQLHLHQSLLEHRREVPEIVHLDIHPDAWVLLYACKRRRLEEQRELKKEQRKRKRAQEKKRREKRGERERKKEREETTEENDRRKQDTQTNKQTNIPQRCSWGYAVPRPNRWWLPPACCSAPAETAWRSQSSGARTSTCTSCRSARALWWGGTLASLATAHTHEHEKKEE